MVSPFTSAGSRSRGGTANHTLPIFHRCAQTFHQTLPPPQGAVCTLSFPGQKIPFTSKPPGWLMDNCGAIRSPWDHQGSDCTRYLETATEALPRELKEKYIDVQYTKLSFLLTAVSHSICHFSKGLIYPPNSKGCFEGVSGRKCSNCWKRCF